jgi:DNA-binding protein YbaB
VSAGGNKKLNALFGRLPEMKEQIERLQEQVKRLEEELKSGSGIGE